mgnify:CR=1 FL=1
MSAQRNVLGHRLEICSARPMTGFFRDGCCNTSDDDLVRVDGWKDTSFCYEAGSNNQVFIDTALFSNWQSGTSRAGFGFVVYREIDGNPFGVSRKVLVPMGTGNPRVLQ